MTKSNITLVRAPNTVPADPRRYGSAPNKKAGSELLTSSEMAYVKFPITAAINIAIDKPATDLRRKFQYICGRRDNFVRFVYEV